MIRLFKEGKIDKANEINKVLYPLIQALFVTSNPIPAKEILLRQGLISSNTVRLPLTPMDEGETKDKVLQHFDDYNLFLTLYQQRQRN